jgi:hypothetical protein
VSPSASWDREELTSRRVACPYCGELLELLIDGSAGSEEYVEDCEVCCNPMTVRARCDIEGSLTVEVQRQDD